jgi:hypothetical protein
VQESERRATATVSEPTQFEAGVCRAAALALLKPATIDPS